MTSVSLQALGDRDPTSSDFADVDALTSTNLPAFPVSTTLVTALSYDANGDIIARGLLSTAASSPIFDGVLLPAQSACPLASGGSSTLAVVGAGAALAASAGGLLVAGGSDAAGRAIGDAAWIDGRDLTITAVPSGMLRRRSGAAAVDVGTLVVIAGGEDGTSLWSDAESFDPSQLAEGFSRDPIALDEPRADVAAVTMSSGAGLLLGGRGSGGALDSLVAIEPGTDGALQSRVIGLTRLDHARIAPRAVRAADGSIVVAGGVDADGAAIPDVEILDPTASELLYVVPSVAYDTLGLAALPSGAVLVVGANAASTSVSLTLVRTDGTSDALADGAASSSQPFSLVDATDGSPLLWDGTWQRFDPWGGAFGPTSDVPATLAADAAWAPAAIGEGGALIGIDASSSAASLAATLSATRYDIRTSLAGDLDPLGTDTAAHLVPDRLSVQRTRQGLVIPAGARVALADATFATLTLTLHSEGRDLPWVELRDPLGNLVARVGDTTCPYPALSATAPAVVSRLADGSIRVAIGDATTSCSAMIATNPRVSLTLLATDEGSRVAFFTASRDGS